MTTLHLTEAERAAVRRVGGAAFMGLVTGHNKKGRPYRPARTAVYRTDAAAELELERLAARIAPSVIISRCEVVVVGAEREQEV